MDPEIKNWMISHFPESEPTLIVDHPWAKTWRLDGGNETLYLKQIIQDHDQKTRASVDISKTFTEFVPNIVAAEPELGVMAVKDHAGTILKSRSKNMKDVLATYSRLQSEAIETEFDNDDLPKIIINELLEDFYSFLDPKTSETSETKAASETEIDAQYFLGPESANASYRLFRHIEPILSEFLKEADGLPQTINHCDLRPPNIARKEDGSLCLFDWDDACFGPIGMSLHSQFSGCLRPYLALSPIPDEIANSEILRDREFLNLYMKTFSDKGFVEPEKIQSSLSAAITAGVLKYIIGFKAYPTKKDSTRKVIGKNITKRLDSVLDVIELFVANRPKQAERLAMGYFMSSNWERLQIFEDRMGQSLLHLPNSNQNALVNSVRLGFFPEITLSDLERDHGVCTPGNVALADRIYREQGVILLKNSLQKSLIEDCREHLFENYKAYFGNDRPDDSLRVGNKRVMITLGLEGPINNPAIYAPPCVMPILKQLLGNKLILGSLVAVASSPGAKDQSRHRDHHALFPGENIFLPPFATSVMIPLIDINSEVGATRVFKGSHLQPTEIAKKMPGQDPEIEVGSCFLMDYRVQHMGLANKSKDKVRPILTLIFQRPWFRDYVNYDKQDRLRLSEEVAASIPQDHQSLFSWMKASNS